ncbi:SDR family oxidoreductase [Vibrio spartinae]|uniref:Cyclopentanol dehydrogenase n=1 Tax=Vibrio spartinae TaxID=1918945 RepID=A0ABX6QY50_9VIBR|nr:SDR family oxidoreductase [Vibrio spartinae]QMV14143.1 Cyclopentanol dehydrogenase [Vibrio spartinae]
MNDKCVVLVTGGNKGIGFQVARELALLGGTVLVGARSETNGKDAVSKLMSEGLRADLIPIDVTDQKSIQTAENLIRERYGRLDVLINNAGIAIDAGMSPSQLSIDTLKQTFETNFFGAFLVTQTMLPLLRNANAGRVVNVSSGLGSLTLNSDPDSEFAGVKLIAYNSSKAALNSLTIQFAYELRDTSIKVNSADPGYTATDLNGHSGTRTVEQAAGIIIKLATLDESGPTGGFFDENGSVPW